MIPWLDGWMLLLAKTCLALLAGFALTAALARATASTRHALWTIVLVGVLVLPIVTFVLPALDLPLLPAQPAATRGAATSLSGVPPATVDVPSTDSAAAAQASTHQPPRGLAAFSWPNALAVVYGLGLAAVALHLLWGLVSLRRLTAGAEDLSARAEWRDLIRAARRTSGKGSACRVRAADVAVPMTWGLFRPVILLPRVAVDWPWRHRRQALLHEAAHVRRSDWAFQIAGRLACALYWFNPLVWIATRRLMLEAERACDDRVLRSGVASDEYAEQLLQLARGDTFDPRYRLAAVPMARRGQLSVRLRSILSSSARRSTMSRRARLTLALSGLILFAALGSVSLVPAGQHGWTPEDDSAFTPLMQAAAGGDVGEVRRLLAQGASAREGVRNHGTPLIVAAAVGNVDVVQALLAAGARADEVYRDSEDEAGLLRTPLATAAHWGHEEIVRVLLDAGAGVDTAPRGDATPLMEAVEHGHQNVAALLIERGADVNRVIRGDGSPLIAAARGGNVDGVDMLLRQGADPNVDVRGDGNPLIAAARSGDMDAVNRLLDAGADANSWVQGDEGPLYHALRSGNAEMVRRLIDQGADVNAEWPGDGSPLIQAARIGDYELVRSLIDAGADVDTGVRGDGSPLIQAARGGSLEVVQLLIDRGATVDKVVSGDENALIQACENGHIDVVSYLIAQGADVNKRVRANGEIRTPLSQAQRGGHDDVIDLLRTHGATD